MPSPVRNMRPARDTCETCHWSEKLHGDRLRVIREYGDDEKNEETVTTLTMHVGGGSRALGVGTGIHWHMNLDNEIEYVTTDAKREAIPDRAAADADRRRHGVRARGHRRPSSSRQGETRRMDCMDCHNRPAHTMAATPERAVNEAMALGRHSARRCRSCTARRSRRCGSSTRIAPPGAGDRHAAARSLSR